MDLWELTARERIRDTLARYNWSGDALRLDELARCFCEDGALEIRGQTAVEGRTAIADLLGGVAASADERVRSAPRDRSPAPAEGRRIVRHNVTNIRFVAISRDEARVECYFTVLTEIGLDHYGRYQDTLVPEGDEWLIRHRFVSTDWRAADSTMARPPT